VHNLDIVTGELSRRTKPSVRSTCLLKRQRGFLSVWDLRCAALQLPLTATVGSWHQCCVACASTVDQVWTACWYTVRYGQTVLDSDRGFSVMMSVTSQRASRCELCRLHYFSTSAAWYSYGISDWWLRHSFSKTVSALSWHLRPGRRQFSELLWRNIGWTRFYTAWQWWLQPQYAAII